MEIGTMKITVKKTFVTGTLAGLTVDSGYSMPTEKLAIERVAEIQKMVAAKTIKTEGSAKFFYSYAGL
jgi:hypothetical protein